ncbi:MAG: flagellin [Pseudomonadota bacterium]
MVISSGFPDILQTNLFDRTVTTTKTNLAKASNELVTGRKSDLSRALGAQVGEYNFVVKARADIESANTRLNLANNRFAQIDNSLNAVKNVVGGFSIQARTDFVLGGPQGLKQTQNSAEAILASTISALNTTHAGRRLFSGDATGSPALADIDSFLTSIETALGGATDSATVGATLSAYFAPGGGFDTDVYIGGDGEAATILLPTGAEVRYETKADNQAFKDIFEGLARIIFAPDDVDNAWVNDAASLVERGEAELLVLQSSVGRFQNLVDQSIELGETEDNILANTEERLVGVDAYEAASEVQRLEVQLEAAYTVSARLANLTLVNFIR